MWELGTLLPLPALQLQRKAHLNHNKRLWEAKSWPLYLGMVAHSFPLYPTLFSLLAGSRFPQHRFTSMEGQIWHIELCSWSWTVHGVWRPRPFVRVCLGICHGYVPKKHPPELPGPLWHRTALCTSCYLGRSSIPRADHRSLVVQLHKRITQCTKQSPGSPSCVQNRSI